MKMNHHYLEVIENEKVVKRISTSLASEYRDRQNLESEITPDQEVRFVMSSSKEKLINNNSKIKNHGSY